MRKPQGQRPAPAFIAMHTGWLLVTPCDSASPERKNQKGTPATLRMLDPWLPDAISAWKQIICITETCVCN